MTTRLGVAVAGRCPACRTSSLFVSDGGHVTCCQDACPNREAASQLLYAAGAPEGAEDGAALVAAISAWIDGSPSYLGIGTEAHLVRRCVKTGEEVGEMIGALYGYLGENPRKGVTHTRDDVVRELLDVALAALGAVEHIGGNLGTALGLLDSHIRSVADRARKHGLTAAPAHDDPDDGGPF